MKRQSAEQRYRNYWQTWQTHRGPGFGFDVQNFVRVRFTHSLMDLSSPSEAANCAATQGIIPAFYGTRSFITVFTETLQ
jgi:hypothetical protein